MTDPIEQHLAYIEAVGRMLSDPHTCRHCEVVVEELGDFNDDLPHAVGVSHQDGCPVRIEEDDAPAVGGLN